MIRRIDRTQARAETILDSLGLNASDAIRLFYKQITLNDGLPFLVKVPNADHPGHARRRGRQGDPLQDAAEMFEKMGT